MADDKEPQSKTRKVSEDRASMNSDWLEANPKKASEEKKGKGE